MPYEPSKLSQTGTAEFYPGEQFDLHSAALDIAPATEVIRQRNEQLLGAAADRVVDQALEDYAKKGIAEIEGYLAKESKEAQYTNAVEQATLWLCYARGEAVKANER